MDAATIHILPVQPIVFDKLKTCITLNNDQTTSATRHSDAR